MTAALLMQAFALVLTAASALVAIVSLSARTLFLACIASAAAMAIVAAALLALQAEFAGLGLVLLGVGVAPVLVFGAALLSARITRAPRRGWRWLSFLAGALAVGAIVAATLEFTPVEPGVMGPSPGPSAAWLVLPLFAAALGCYVLLGLGERGVLDSPPEREL